MMLHFLLALALLAIEANGFSWGSKSGYVRSSQSATQYLPLISRKCEIKLGSLNHKNTALSERLRAGGETNDANRIVKKNKLVHWYMSYTKLVDEKPLMTQSITVGLISALGDILSQWIEANVAGVMFSFNWLRFNSFLISGTLFVGPFLHYWYGVLWKVGRWGQEKYMLSKRYQTMMQVVLDQTIGVAIFFPAYFFLYEFTEALLSLRAPLLATATGKVYDELIPVLLMQYRVWPIINWLNFEYVPQNLRILVSNVVAIFWNAYLCAKIA